MSEARYKKTYEGDYKKSYKDFTLWKQESAQRRQEYQTISKKLDDSPYNKKERSDFYDITGRKPKESERVYAEGARTRQHKPQKPISSSHTTSIPSTPGVTKPTPTVRTTITKPTIVEEPIETVKPEMVDDGNYNLYNPPIRQVGHKKYLNLKTNEEIGENEARRILQLAGYAPRKGFSVGTLIFSYVFLSFIAPPIAPLAAIAYGLIKMFSSSNTTWIKNTGKQFFHFVLPRGKEDQQSNKYIAQAALIIGVIALVIRYHHLITS